MSGNMTPEEIYRLLENNGLLAERTAKLHDDLREALRNEPAMAWFDRIAVQDGMKLEDLVAGFGDMPPLVIRLAVRCLLNRISAARCTAAADLALQTLAKFRRGDSLASDL